MARRVHRVTAYKRGVMARETGYMHKRCRAKSGLRSKPSGPRVGSRSTDKS
jgi:hypothetical protein